MRVFTRSLIRNCAPLNLALWSRRRKIYIKWCGYLRTDLVSSFTLFRWCTSIKWLPGPWDQFEVTIWMLATFSKVKTQTLTGCEIDSWDNITHQRWVKAYGCLWITTARPYAGFQLKSKVNCTAEKWNRVQDGHKMAEQERLALVISIF